MRSDVVHASHRDPDIDDHSLCGIRRQRRQGKRSTGSILRSVREADAAQEIFESRIQRCPLVRVERKSFGTATTSESDPTRSAPGKLAKNRRWKSPTGKVWPTAPTPSDARRPARADVKRSQGIVSRKRESAVLYER